MEKNAEETIQYRLLHFFFQNKTIYFAIEVCFAVDPAENSDDYSSADETQDYLSDKYIEKHRHTNVEASNSLCASGLVTWLRLLVQEKQGGKDSKKFLMK